MPETSPQSPDSVGSAQAWTPDRAGGGENTPNWPLSPLASPQPQTAVDMQHLAGDVAGIRAQ